MKKYWKSILIVVLPLIVFISYYSLSKNSGFYPDFEFQTIEGDDEAASEIILHGDLFMALGSGNSFKVSPHRQAQYIDEENFSSRLRGYFLPNRLEKMLSDHKSFMRGKELYSDVNFYQTEDKIVYVNVLTGIFDQSTDQLKVDVLDKTSEKRQTFDVTIPDAANYWGLEVNAIYQQGQNVYVATTNYQDEVDDAVSIYEIDLKTEQVSELDHWDTKSQGVEAYKFIDVLQAEADPETLLLVEQKSTYDEETGIEEESVQALTQYNLKTKDKESLPLVEELAEITAFDENYLYTSKIKKDKIELQKIDQATGEIVEELALDFAMSQLEGGEFDLLTKEVDNKLYIEILPYEDSGEVGVAVVTKDDFKGAYLGKVAMAHDELFSSDLEYYFGDLDIESQ